MRSRDLYIMCAARAVSVLGNQVALTALLWDSRGGWAMAGLLLAGTAPMVVFAPVIGVVVDRCDSRTLIVGSSLAQAAVCTVLAFVDDQALILALVALNAVGSAVIGPTFGAVVRHLAPVGQLVRATSAQQTANVAATMAGPALGGLLTGLSGGTRLPLLVDAATFFGLTAAGLLIGVRRPGPFARTPRLRDGVAMLLGDRVVRGVTCLLLASVVMGQVVAVAELMLVRDVFGGGAITFGLLTAVFAGGLLFGTVIAGKLGHPRRLLAMAPFGAGVMAVGIGVAGVSSTLIGVFGLYAIAGTGAGVVNVASTALVVLRAPAEAAGQVQATMNGLVRATGIGALAMGGLAVSTLTPGQVFLLCGIVGLVVTFSVVGLLSRTPALI